MAGLNDASGSNDSIFEAEYLGSLGYSGTAASHGNFWRSYTLGPDSFGVHDIIDYYNFQTVGLTQIKIDIHPFGIPQGRTNYQAGIAYNIIAGAEITSVIILSDGGNQDGIIEPYLSDWSAIGYDYVIYEDFLFSPEFDKHLIVDITPGTEVYLEVSSPGVEIWDSEGDEVLGYQPLTYIVDITPRSGIGGSDDDELTPPSSNGEDTVDWLTITGDYDAGAGLDTVIFFNEVAPYNSLWAGDFKNWDITFEDNTIIINGYHRFTNVERLEFDDGVLMFDLDSPNADFAYRMYTAAYFRTPDEGGFRYWADVMERPELGGDGDLSYQDKLVLANEFLKADEFMDVYGRNPSNEHYVQLMYENVLGREFDQDGRDYWLGRMEEGAGRDEILTVFVDSLENLANTAEYRDDGFWVI